MDIILIAIGIVFLLVSAYDYYSSSDRSFSNHIETVFASTIILSVGLAIKYFSN
ncbi:hypothetical protein ISR92_00880 [Patescibacteria group bacterium]|nr:hypothetical protein [Patescibacteria group bacterium]